MRCDDANEGSILLWWCIACARGRKLRREGKGKKLNSLTGKEKWREDKRGSGLYDYQAIYADTVTYGY